jgi:hypothetical protein
VVFKDGSFPGKSFGLRYFGDGVCPPNFEELIQEYKNQIHSLYHPLLLQYHSAFLDQSLLYLLFNIQTLQRERGCSLQQAIKVPKDPTTHA